MKVINGICPSDRVNSMPGAIVAPVRDTHIHRDDGDSRRRGTRGRERKGGLAVSKGRGGVGGCRRRRVAGRNGDKRARWVNGSEGVEGKAERKLGKVKPNAGKRYEEG